MLIRFNTKNAADYRRFLAVRLCPVYCFEGNAARVPDEYADRLGITPANTGDAAVKYTPIDGMFDYQRDITRLAIQKRKFAIFADCGLGKTLMLLEFSRHVIETTGKRVDRKSVV